MHRGPIATVPQSTNQAYLSEPRLRALQQAARPISHQADCAEVRRQLTAQVNLDDPKPAATPEVAKPTSPAVTTPGANTPPAAPPTIDANMKNPAKPKA